MSYDNFNADANQVFNYHPSSGFKVKASHRLSLSDSLTASLYTRLARSADNATTSISLVPKFKFVRDDFSATAAVFAGSNAAPQLELTATIYNFLINGLRNTITFATPSFGANGKDLNAQATLTTSSRLFLESSRATLDVTSDLPRGSASVALALPLPQALTAGFKAALDQGVGVKSLDVALQLGASGLTITGKGLATAAPAVWNASYYARLSQTLAIAAEVDSLRYVRVGALHDATPFTALRVKLDNNSRAAIAADTVFSSALSGSFGVDFDVNNRRDLKWGVSLKFH